MYQALDFKKCLEWFAPIMGVVTLIVLLIRGPKEVFDYFEAIELSGLISVTIVAVIGKTKLFHAVWRTRLMQKSLFPYVAGRYEGTISSNWSLIDRIRKAATASGTLVESELAVSESGLFEKAVTVEVKADLFSISMKLVPKDGYSDSFTVFLRPERHGEAGYPRLYYMYRATVAVAKGTDVSVHFGAAYMDVKEDASGLMLEGVYWTERGWHKAMNTAGVLKVRKVT